MPLYLLGGAAAHRGAVYALLVVPAPPDADVAVTDTGGVTSLSASRSPPRLLSGSADHLVKV